MTTKPQSPITDNTARRPLPCFVFAKDCIQRITGGMTRDPDLGLIMLGGTLDGAHAFVDALGIDEYCTIYDARLLGGADIFTDGNAREIGIASVTRVGDGYALKRWQILFTDTPGSLAPRVEWDAASVVRVLGSNEWPQRFYKGVAVNTGKPLIMGGYGYTPEP